MLCSSNKNIQCTCPKGDKCPNWGKCCSCVAKHRTTGGLPHCLRGNVKDYDSNIKPLCDFDNK